MTGYSKAEIHEQGIGATVEVKSVNGRYLETSVKLPRLLSHRELDIREVVRKTLSRGNVFVSVSLDIQEGDARVPRMNPDKASALFESLEQLRKHLKITQATKIEHVLEFSQYFLETDKDDQSEQQWTVVEKALRQALAGLEKSRAGEGAELARDLKSRIQNIESDLIKVEQKAATRIPEEREKMRQRIAQLFDNDEIDEQRLQQEIIFLADKLDIAEECVRLRSHIKFFNDMLASGEPVGRKLNFLLQEMNREVNTIGSKGNDTEIAHLVVGMKEELERIREQAQNIE